MQVYKFGGASIKDAAGIRNVRKVLETTGFQDKLLVVSAVGKTTNALESIIDSYRAEDDQLEMKIQQLYDKHLQIIADLFPVKGHPIYEQINYYFQELRIFFDRNKSPNYDFVYDQVVCFGELMSTSIVSQYLNDSEIKNTWIDIRNMIKTDATYRDAQVDWQQTRSRILEQIKPKDLYITQGFIASDANNFTTTLGREGSDYTAAIIAHSLSAESVLIWKDVPGVLNADPRVFRDTQLLHQISYEEAIELAFYGASVIHPKTIQPLQEKEIPLQVRSFIQPEKKGTVVTKGDAIQPITPCFIVKKNLALLSLSSLDFSFFVEENISELFALFHRYQIKADLIQNSAISFSVCIDNKFGHLDEVVQILKQKFSVREFNPVSLYTIRHFDEASIESIEKKNKVLLKQVTQETIQFVTQAVN
jgi:aspartate kinase